MQQGHLDPLLSRSVTLAAAACQGLLVAVLVVSAASKLRSSANFRSFAASLKGTGLIAPAITGSVAAAVAAAEGSAALLLVLPTTKRGGFALAALLLAVLTGGVALVVRRGRPVVCRCFGASDNPLQARHVLRNGFLLVIAVIGACAASSPVNASAVVAALIGAVCAVPLILLDDLYELFGQAIQPQGRS